MKRSVSKKINVKKQNKKNLIILVALVIIMISGLVTTAYFQYTKERGNSNAQAASTGWLSGSSCNGTSDGSFAAWRGSPETIAGTWDDGDVNYQKNMPTLGTLEYANWDQNVDVTNGAFWGSTWANAANGGDDANLHASLASIDRQWGNKKTIFIRYAHEFNGDWDQWKVLPSDNASYIKAFDNFYKMVQTDLVAKGRDAKVVWSPNSDDHNGIAASDSWPGDQFVDVVGVDWYDWDVLSTQAKWDSDFMKNGSNGGPYGVGAWQAFAKAHGKPLAFPEWGTTGEGPVEDPFFVQKMNDFFRANAGTGPGQVWYEIYFNCGGQTWQNSNGQQKFQIYPVANLPQTSAMYKSLKWGDGGTVALSPTQQSPTLPAATVVPTDITPTLYCAGSGLCIPSKTSTPPGGDQTSPTLEVTQDLQPSDTPDLTQIPGDSVTQTPRNGGGRKQSLYQLLLQFITILIALLMKLFGK